MVRKLIFVLFIYITHLECTSQILEFSNLTKLPSSVNSDAEETMPLLSPDQTKLFFVRSLYEGNVGGRYSGQDIWYSEHSAQGWKRADNKQLAANTKDNNALVGMNGDGKVLYMLNNSPSAKLAGIYFSRLVNTYWTRPEFIPLSGIDNQDFVGMYAPPDLDVIFISMRDIDSRGEEDIYISIKSAAGYWSKPKNIGPTINTSGFEISPFLSADKKRLYFASNGHKGMGDADIFYSERLYNSWETWSAPINLGPVVNSNKFDAYFSIYGDTVAYFTSNRDAQLSDIYKVNVAVRDQILDPGKRYLSDDDWDGIVGKSVSSTITFQPKVTTLNAAQKELLYYIANKVSRQKNVGVHVVIKAEEDPLLTQERIKAIYGELRQAGIDPDLIVDKQGTTIKKSNEGVVKLILFR